ncbi:MAG: hypothetical protein ABIH69_03845 [bacterium]|nr:hypothetical protein [Candidatus Margulisiibacteriota bacterium]
MISFNRLPVGSIIIPRPRRGGRKPAYVSQLRPPEITVNSSFSKITILYTASGIPAFGGHGLVIINLSIVNKQGLAGGLPGYFTFKIPKNGPDTLDLEIPLNIMDEAGRLFKVLPFEAQIIDILTFPNQDDCLAFAGKKLN